jgi:hypothetical protein
MAHGSRFVAFIKTGILDPIGAVLLDPHTVAHTQVEAAGRVVVMW